MSWAWGKANTLFLLALLLSGSLQARQVPVLTLEEAQEQARQHYPISRQRDLLLQTEQFTLENLSKGYLPQVGLNGQATYQSAVTQLPISLPGVEIIPLPKEQYKVFAEVSQLVFDGGLIRQQKKAAQLQTAVETQKVEVELLRLQDRINQLYLGTLLLDAQLKQVDLVQLDLEAGIRRVEAQVKNEVSFKSNLYLLQAELLKNNQRRAELRSARQATLQTLGLFVGQALPESVVLPLPVPTEVMAYQQIQRPELKVYSFQQSLLEQQQKLLLARNLPKASLFGQTGYGRPGLNFLQNQADFWYMGGFRLNWSLGNLYTARNDRKLIGVNQQLTQIQLENFLLNTNAQLTQQRAEIDKLQQLVVTDQEIVGLREKVKAAASAQLSNSVITPNDYLREVYAEDQARQTLILHQLQLLQAQINYKTTLGY
ncbi:transporter [Rufibacter radiotolerans]|uniref:Transporter n=1 Tax=Rufibacter radiotolerans TaxID=1379910 RepID=A0A0H4VQI2_9BACT|nr:transporter [Rufibacter radiotolerans]